jgi:hypothetical protein
MMVMGVDFFYKFSGTHADVAAVESELLLHRAWQTHNDIMLATETSHTSSISIKTKEFTTSSQTILNKLLALEPRSQIPSGSFPLPFTGSSHLPKDGSVCLYAGSGVSYEAKLPTLSDIHEFFGVDDPRKQSFVFGSDDLVLKKLRNEFLEFVRDALAFNISAAIAAPSESHLKFTWSAKNGYLSRIITDNLDFLFEKGGIAAERVRTIFPHSDGIKFSKREKTLLVVGIAADRRGIISSARRQGLRILVVNPQLEVSPKAQNLSYLEEGDIWYRMTSHNFCLNHLVWL